MRFARWTGRSDRGRSALMMALAIIWTIALIVGIGLSTLPGKLWAVCIGIFAVPTAAFLYSRQRTIARLTQRLEADPEELPVRMTVTLDALHLGSDEGMLCLERGWLIFRGARTEWSVRASDVTGSGDGFLFTGPAGRVRSVGLQVLSRSADLQDLLRRWRDAPPVPGEAVFPPAAIERRGAWWLEAPGGHLALSVPFVGGWLSILVVPATVAWALFFVTLGFGLVAARALGHRHLARAQALPEGS